MIALNYRALALGLLLVLLAGVCVQFAATDQWSYPGTDDIASDPEASDGEVVFLFGEVQSVDGTSERMVVLSGTETRIELTVGDVPATVTESVEVGASVQIYGTLREGSTAVDAEAVVVDFGDGTDRLYAYATSVLGGILAALYFLRFWDVDLRRLRFTPRGEQ